MTEGLQLRVGSYNFELLCCLIFLRRIIHLWEGSALTEHISLISPGCHVLKTDNHVLKHAKQQLNGAEQTRLVP